MPKVLSGNDSIFDLYHKFLSSLSWVLLKRTKNLYKDSRRTTFQSTKSQESTLREH